MIDHGKLTETYVAEILQNKKYCGKYIYLKTSINEVTKNKMFCGKFIERNLSVASDMAVYYTQYKHIHNLDESLPWENIK